MKRTLVVLIIVMSMVLVGCSTLFGPSSVPEPIKPEPSEAEVVMVYGVGKGLPGMVRKAIALGIDVNKELDGVGAPSLGAIIVIEEPEKASEIVKILADAGADMNWKGARGITTLMMAASRSPKAVVTALLENDADVNMVSDDGYTALMMAAKSTKYPDILEALLSAGADLSLVDKDGNTAYSYALKNKSLSNLAIVGLLDPNRVEFVFDDKPHLVNGFEISIKGVRFDSDGRLGDATPSSSPYIDDALVQAMMDVTKSFRPKDGERWLVVDVLVTNTTNAQKSMSSYNFTLLDEDFYSHDKELSASTKGDLNANVGPGRSIRGEVGFAVGSNQTRWELIYTKPSFINSVEAIFPISLK